MRKIILASHGRLSEGMKDSVEMILGKKEELSYIGLFPGEQPSELYGKVEKTIDDDNDNEFIVVTDVIGGSVNTALLQLIRKERVHVVCGMHLGLILSLCTATEENTEKMIHQVLKDTSGYIIYANDLLKQI